MALRIQDGPFIPSVNQDRSQGLAGAGRVKATSPVPGDALEQEPSAFSKVFRGLGREIDAGEKTMDRVVRGHETNLGSSELLALQAQVYRYSEAVDLAAKLVDRATNGVKTVIQGQ